MHKTKNYRAYQNTQKKPIGKHKERQISWLRLAVVSGPLPGHSPTLARPCSVAAEFLNLDMCRPFSKLVKSGLFGDIAVCVVIVQANRWTAT